MLEQRLREERMKQYSILFLCTGNSARSILGEALANQLGKRFRAYSAGSHPVGRVNPYALELLEREGIATAGLRSKSWDEFSGPDAPQFDFIITVCDQAAGEQCPLWVGHPMTAHWGIPDPAAVAGSEDAIRRAFADAARVLKRRIDLLASLPIEKLDRLSLKQHLSKIGQQ